MRRRRVYGQSVCQDRARAMPHEVSNEQSVGCWCHAIVGANGCVALSHRIGQSPRMPTRTEFREASVARPRANPSLHPTCYSGLRPLPQAGELKRWATAEYEAPMRNAVHLGITEHIERVPHVRLCGRCAGRAAEGTSVAGAMLCGPRLSRAARPSAVGAPPSYATSACL
jgi:hypothetical protein